MGATIYYHDISKAAIGPSVSKQKPHTCIFAVSTPFTQHTTTMWTIWRWSPVTIPSCFNICKGLCKTKINSISLIVLKSRFLRFQSLQDLENTRLSHSDVQISLFLSLNRILVAWLIQLREFADPGKDPGGDRDPLVLDQFANGNVMLPCTGKKAVWGPCFARSRFCC